MKQKIRDQYELSDGNLLVLKKIPEMMKHEKYRKELRKLVIDFECRTNFMFRPSKEKRYNWREEQ